ncbi:myosin-VIIa [Salpingoeca rosetta]|uniref:Myosin-VIIa n=1 Tax=Salpingoeca rosetta (strain ATCC 50818 / BSB-021) TaxID=946362 RepID=F2U0V3_SALR5|nr:myosin-VIIa [Salpingoeca rosetta]EGD80527.1 myosin-VIIa [Salpingoeca rosetta]|eukprot:XP_004997088.1 myosin-VIIa [Salpingoeca rosetta]
MVVVAKGDLVWYDAGGQGEFDLPIGARVKQADSGQIIIVTDENEEIWVPTAEADAKLKIMHPTSANGVEDMIQLGDLHEAGILRNLQIRYNDPEGCKLYTYTGSILVAVNPYQALDIYDGSHMETYKNTKIGDLPPHIFAIADAAYTMMRRDKRNQCCVISGESGAGKTETTKLVLQFLAAVSGQHSWIEQQILEANPIMEAFGNAKTIRNDNSSRFGKYIDISFDEDGAIEGASIEQYLLEKSRLSFQAADERNYHVFYRLIVGSSAEELSALGLTKCEDYAYLTGGDCINLPGVDDREEWGGIRGAMKVLGFTEEEQWNIFRLVAAFLHMGNTEFEESEVNNMMAAEVVNMDAVESACKLFQCDAEAMADALTTQTTVTRGETIVKQLDNEKATDVRDAFVKQVYGRIFVWIVDKINSTISKQSKRSAKRTSIGVLDIFGFENFTQNSFEQLCINFCNENLQQFFVQHIFKLEQLEYDKEGINWSKIDFQDNQPVLDMIAEKPMNILALVDEEAKFPKGTDESMLTKLHQHHDKNGLYLKPRARSDPTFGICHFAGNVYYHSHGFLDKNRDTFSNDLVGVISDSENQFLVSLFESDMSAGSETRSKKQTLASQFKRSLDALMKTLGACNPYFVRCIKPNEYKKPNMFDRLLCTRQLRYSGMMETIRIRRAGYPIRHSFAEFIARYRLLDSSIPPAGSSADKENALKLATRVLGEAGAADWQAGHTKVFLKDAHDQKLEDAREDAFTDQAVVLQRVLRGAMARARFTAMKSSMLVVQTRFRAHLARQRFAAMRTGFGRLQATIRMKKLSQNFQATRTNILGLQTRIRGFLARQTHRSIVSAVENMQAIFSMVLALQRVDRLRKEAAAEAERQAAIKRGLAAAEADRQKQEALKRIEDEDRRRKEEAEAKRREIAQAEAEKQARDDRDVNDAQLVDEMFGFVEEEEGVRGEGPLGFQDLPEAPQEEFDAPEGFGFDSRVIPESEEDVSQFKFSKFAGTYFQGNANAFYIRRPIKQPLLALKNPADQQAALSVWITILRFMGDMPEPKYQRDSVSQGKDNQSVMGRMYKTLGRRFSKKNLRESDDQGASAASMSVDEMLQQQDQQQQQASEGGDAPEEEKKSLRKKLASMTLRKKSKMSKEMQEQIERERQRAEAEEAGEANDNAVMPLQQRPTSNLEKLHFIIGHGILRPELRDEIYCQICKQLTQNPSKSSHARGWILLSLCLGCFAPSDRFVKYLRCFIGEGPPGYAPYCEERLKRTQLNGTRHQPPSWLELQATKSKKPLMLPITFMDGNTKTLLADSATTASELCDQLAEKIGLQDKFGFSLYIALFDKVSSLGSGGDHVMDAISQCEQYAKEQGAQERNAPWRLFFRKEIFAPWHDPAQDEVGTNLIYQQVVRGIKFGEYRCEKDEQLAEIAAKQFYVEYGPDMDTERLIRLIPSYIPDSALQARSPEKWAPRIEKCHARAEYTRNCWPVQRVKEDVVTFAKNEWPLLFSRFYEAYKFSGPSLPKNDVIIAVNWTGVYIVDDQERVLLECSYPEITNVSSSRSGKSQGQSFTITTVKGDEYTFTSTNGDDIRDLVLTFLEGLRHKSKFCVAMTDYSSPGDGSSFLSLTKGDLIVLDQDDGSSVLHSGWCFGRNDRTGEEGDFPANCVYVLPALTKPSKDILHLFQDQSDEAADALVATGEDELDEEEVGAYTLDAFAAQHFRAPPKKSLTRTLGRRSFKRGSSRATPWSHSRDVIKQPLLLKICEVEDLSIKAVQIYQNIMKYMGDYPSKKARCSTELTDLIFEFPLAHEPLRDEVYCQLIKQLTDNKTRISEERGWELFWLCTGCFPCSTTLLKEVNAFLRSKAPRQPVATDCQNRLTKIIRAGQRKYPPHLVEVEAIQNKKLSIYHKVYFPDDSDQAFEVDSSTRAKDFCQAIGKRLQLASVEGFSLFVKIADKVISVPEGDFFFDFVRHLTEWLKKTKQHASGQNPNLVYQVFFMRKLWSNTVVGKDPNADCIFHYHQELPKLLRGYHKCTKEEAVQLAALQYRVRFGDDKKEFGSLPHMLKELVPYDMIDIMSPDEWKRAIVLAFNKHSGKSPQDAKISFLKIIARWPTFGSAFFEVRQTTETHLPQQLLIAINKNGVNLINPENKEVLQTHPFTKISNWSSGGTYFHMAIGSMVKGSKLLCETTLGYKMDDLLTSYISLMLSNMKKKKKRNNSHLAAGQGGRS